MTDEVIPEDIKQFILQNIDSIAQLEGLLLMRANAHVSWSPETIALKLYIYEMESAQLLAQMLTQDFLTASGGLYQYKPRSPEMEQMIGRVAELYKHCLVPITHLIHSKPRTKVQKFADAFRIRKEKD
jgi:hypothetical protein